MSKHVMTKNNKLNSSNEEKSFLRDSSSLILKGLGNESRRRFLRQSITLGGIMMLTGCDISSDTDLDSLLGRMSKFNDRAQAWLFNNERLAPVYSESDITRPFPFNAFYGMQDIPVINKDIYKLEVSGSVLDSRSWSLEQLYQLPNQDQITRHICVEGWSAIGRWGGVRLSDFLKLIGADVNAKYVSFRCADNYYTSIDMASALHPQTIIALTWDGHLLPPEYGYPLKIRIPTKLGYKNPKHVVAIEVTNRYTGGYWEDQGYNWFGGS